MSQQTVRWSIIPMPLSNGPCEVVAFDYFGPLPVTDRGSSNILLFTDHFSRHTVMYAVSAADFTAAGTASILVDRYIPLWGCPVKRLSDNGTQFRSDLS